MEQKIKHLPGTKLAPEVLLHRTLQKIDRIKSVIVVIQWDDDTFDSDWSSQKVSELCMGSMVLANQVTTIISGDE